MRTSVWTLIRYSSDRQTWTRELVKLLRLVRTPWKPWIRALCSMFIPCKSLSFPINCCCVWILKGQESIPVGAYCPLSNRACFGGRGRGVKYLEGYLYNPPGYLPLGYLPSPDASPLGYLRPSPNGPRTKDFYPSLPSRDLGLEIPTPPEWTWNQRYLLSQKGPGTRDTSLFNTLSSVIDWDIGF